MLKHSITQRLGWGLFVILSLSLGGLAQDQGFDVVYEGVVDSETKAAPSNLNLTLYGIAGTSANGAFWASAGTRMALTLGDASLTADVGYGMNGLEIQGGIQTKLLGFGVAGDVSWRPSTTPVIDLRGWGGLDAFQFTANARLAGANSAITLSGSTEFEGFGLSANLAMAGGTLSQASLGANMGLGGLSLSGSAGMTGGQVNVGGGCGLQLGPANLIASAGYDGGLGLNATAGATLGWEGFDASAIGQFDNTGVGLEASAELRFGQTRLTFMGRFSTNTTTFEVGGTLPLGPIA
ncbi:hypothetical protein KKG90_11475, partial [Candidatus Bipolaricaulota bacterium]|nr:hypothetical protein [Candidatus Bipolaricaulota bacterium]